MLRTIVVRNELLRETLKKAIRINTARALSVECTRRRHRNNQPTILKSTNKLQWKYNAVRYYAGLPAHQRVELPALSPTMETGSIVSWEKKEGDKLNEGDLLCEIETDKATMGFETPEEGYLAKIVIPAGTKGVPIGKLVCIIVANQADVAAFKDFKDDASAPAAAAPAPAAAAPAPAAAAPAPAAAPPTPSPAAPSVPSGGAPGDRVYASPMAKRLAEQRQIRLQGKGTGMYDSITSRDVPSAGAAKAAAPAARAPSPARSAPPKPAPGGYVDIPVTNMRATIAKRLTESKLTSPHVYITAQVNVDNLNDVRTKFNKALEKEKVKISVNDFIIKAMALASKKVPEVNSMWMGSYIRQFNSVDVSVAVSTDKGLITPIVFNADSIGLVDISKKVKELAEKARNNKLQPHEFQGGTITISNMGMFGVNLFAAVINPPQAAILAVGTSEQKLVLDKSSEKGFRETNVINATICCDHRVIDGAVAAKWLDVFRKNIEDPQNMLL